jgi:hypothetical protein
VTGSRWRKLLAGVLVVGVVVLGWLVARRGLRLWWWDSLVGTPLDEAALQQLERCEDPGFPAWVRVLTADGPVACGEAWVVETLATHAVRGDQATWLTELVVSPSTPDGARFRAAMALAAAGRVPPVEPAWLRLRLPGDRVLANRSLYASPELAALLGPAGVALGLAERAITGEAEAVDVLPALRWLGAVGEPEADEAVVRAVEALTGVDEAVVGDLRRRHARGGPVAGSEAPARDDLARFPCPTAPCVGAALVALEASVLASAAFRAAPVGAAAPGDVVLDRTLSELGWSAGDRAAMDWQLGALRAWVADHPERLRGLWVRPPTGSVLRLGWDGGGAPFLTAVVVDRATPEVDDVFRSERGDAVWTAVAGDWAARTCGTVGLEPPPTDWRLQEVYARAALESGPAGAHLAKRLDPTLPHGVPLGDPVAHGLGRALRGTAPGAVTAARVVDGFCPVP